MAKATYFNDLNQGRLLDILAKNADGTLNLGVDGALDIGNCPVATAPTIGHAVLLEEVGALTGSNEGTGTSGGLESLTKPQLLEKIAAYNATVTDDQKINPSATAKKDTLIEALTAAGVTD